MKNLLFIFGLLLTADVYCIYDTISTESVISSIRVLPEGTVVNKENYLNLGSGNYVLELKDIPPNVVKEDLSFDEPGGLSILNIDIKVTQQNYDNQNFTPLKEVSKEIEALTFSIKKLNKSEKELLLEKKRKLQEELTLEQEQSFANYYRKQDISIRQKRRDAYLRLMNLREQSENVGSRIAGMKPDFTERNNSVLITFILVDSLQGTLKWKYIIRPEVKRNKSNKIWQQKEYKTDEIPGELPAYVDVKGTVIENTHQAPIVFATIEFYQKGKLVSSTSTGYDGKFSLPLATRETYTMVISFNGYKKKKFKKIFLNQAIVPEKTIRMQVRHKVSAPEILAYSLPVLDMLRFLVK